MTWGTFGKIVLLIIIFAFVTTFVNCLHDMKCAPCKGAVCQVESDK